MDIYKIQNMLDGKVYIGKTVRDPERRFSEHIKDAENDHDSFLSRAIRKHGCDSFTFSVIDETALDGTELNKLEKSYIKQYDCCALDGSDKGYNLTRGGDGLDSDAARLNVKRQIENGTFPLTSELAIRLNSKRMADGSHHFLDPGWAKEMSKQAKQRVSAGTHNFLGGEIQRKMVADGRHPWQGEDASRIISARNLAKVADGSHPWIGEEHSRRMKELVAKKLADGTHNSRVMRICPHCNKEGKGAAMIRWHFDNCKEAK